MRAVVMHDFGGPEVLEPLDVRAPKVPPGWAAVGLAGSALNWHDVLVRRGQYGSPLPHVPGADGAGVRRDTGERVIILPSLSWGSREAAPEEGWEILGDHRWGTYAEQVVVPAENLAPWPVGHSLDEAASLGLVGLTVYRALFSRGRLKSPEWVLVLGASGGVATAAVSFATAVGATVAVTSASPVKIDQAVANGAVGGLDHGAVDWVEAARDLTPGGRGFDLVLDPVGRWSEALACLRPGGRCVVLGASAQATAQVDVRSFYFRQLEVIGTTMGSPADFRGLSHLLATHDVRPPVIDAVFSLDDAAAAHARMESGVGFGKILLHH